MDRILTSIPVKIFVVLFPLIPPSKAVMISSYVLTTTMVSSDLTAAPIIHFLSECILARLPPLQSLSLQVGPNKPALHTGEGGGGLLLSHLSLGNWTH